MADKIEDLIKSSLLNSKISHEDAVYLKANVKELVEAENKELKDWLKTYKESFEIATVETGKLNRELEVYRKAIRIMIDDEECIPRCSLPCGEIDCTEVKVDQAIAHARREIAND